MKDFDKEDDDKKKEEKAKKVSCIVRGATHPTFVCF